ncbi:MAG: hypothetical protein ACR2GO_00765 [Candidatus Limnocylindria bacterium]
MKRTKLPALMLCAAMAAMLPSAAVAAPARDSGIGVVEVRAAPDFDLPAVQLRIGLDRILAEHAFLIIEAMRTASSGGDEFEVAAAVLEGNTVELVDMIDTAYGADAAEAFAEQWRNHIAFLVDYTRAAADGDDDARDLASSQLQTYIDDFSEFLVAANPGLPPDVVKGLIDEHVQQLEQIASLTDDDYSDAYPGIRETYAHMFMVGDGLALGIVDRFGDRFDGRETAFSPALDLRLTFDRLLGEHTYLTAIAMRARLNDAPDLEAAIAALDESTNQLAAQIGTLYGADSATAFDELWTRNTGLFVEYVAAVGADDGEAQQAAIDGLDRYKSDFDAFLVDANPTIAAGELEALIETHTEQLVAQVAAYRDGDFETAYGSLRDAYGHTELVAAALAGAIADQFPQQFPDAALIREGANAALVSAGLLLLSSVAVLVGRRHRMRLTA